MLFGSISASVIAVSVVMGTFVNMTQQNVHDSMVGIHTLHNSKAIQHRMLKLRCELMSQQTLCQNQVSVRVKLKFGLI